MPPDHPSLESLLTDPALRCALKDVLNAWRGRDPLEAASDAATLAAVLGERVAAIRNGVAGRDDAEIDCLLSWPQVSRLTGLRRTTAWRMRQAGDFPQPVRMTPGRVAWRKRDISAWIESRPLLALRSAE